MQVQERIMDLQDMSLVTMRNSSPLILQGKGEREGTVLLASTAAKREASDRGSGSALFLAGLSVPDRLFAKSPFTILPVTYPTRICSLLPANMGSDRTQSVTRSSIFSISLAN